MKIKEVVNDLSMNDHSNGPRRVVKVHYPRYELVTSDGKSSIKPIHARRVNNYTRILLHMND